jgi:hypothetical protein
LALEISFFAGEAGVESDGLQVPRKPLTINTGWCRSLSTESFSIGEGTGFERVCRADGLENKRREIAVVQRSNAFGVSGQRSLVAR